MNATLTFWVVVSVGEDLYEKEFKTFDAALTELMHQLKTHEAFDDIYIMVEVEK